MRCLLPPFSNWFVALVQELQLLLEGWVKEFGACGLRHSTATLTSLVQVSTGPAEALQQ